MIILSNDSDIMDTSLEELISIDRKANILECFRLINMEVPSRYTKTDLAEIYDIFFHRDTGWILNKIPKAEWPILFALLLKKQDEYVKYPRNGQQSLFLQKCYLVVTYQTKDTWHLNIYINEMVTAWIDETDGFEYPFNTLMTLSA